MTKKKSDINALIDAKSLPMKEKLKVLDQEIRKLHNACTEAGYEPNKIRELAAPALRSANRGEKKMAAKVVVCCLICSIAFGWACYYCWTNDIIDHYLMHPTTRHILVYWILPYYDWTWLSTNLCVIENPFYKIPTESSVNFSSKNCERCYQNVNLKPEANVDPAMITERIFDFLPSIIGDAMTDWKATTEEPDLDTFIEMFATDEKLMDIEDSHQTRLFRTSYGKNPKLQSVQSFAKYIYEEGREGRKPNFTVNWINSNKDSYQALHYYYVNPYFLPAMCQPLKFNYLMMARQQTPKKATGLIFNNILADGVWIAQVYGRYEFILQPNKICQQKCGKLRFVLEKGQVLNVPVGLYSIAYRPNSTEAVAIAVGYEF